MGGRIVASVDWSDAVDRIAALAVRPVILLDARGEPEEQLADVLARLDGLAAGRDLAIVAGISETQIDVAAAGLRLSDHQILCAPCASDWVAALATARPNRGMMLHDPAGEGEAVRLALLNAEVARITDVLARLSQREDLPPSRPSVNDLKLGYAVAADGPPDIAASDVRQIVRARRMRDRHFGAGMFEDPAWDTMLDLYAANLERAQVSVSSLCIAAAVAPTTALRWIARLTDAGLFERRPDPFDRRRAFMSLRAIFERAESAGIHTGAVF
jgi:DNA-binding MarR family transcriptional regulator